ncbi:MAG: Arm DNA-binding domain-containing protein [Rickettsiales bacterium]|jgi:hypothetical protein|nr:Arm DNA-binding domain-containing protein [Rickettsiales bacterium]
MKITKISVDEIDYPGNGQVFYWDDTLMGFGLWITSTRKTYVDKSRVGGRTVRNTIALHGSMTPEEARREAKNILGMSS